MKTLLKWIAASAAALLVLAVATTFALRALVDEERLRSTLLELVNARIDGELRIEGPLAVSLWPALSLNVADVHLTTPHGAPQDFASARELRLGVALLSLLSEQLQVHELHIVGLRLAAACDRSGQCNWASLGGSSADAPPAAAAQAAGGAAAAPLALDIERVRIEDAELGFSDERDGTRLEVKALALSGDGINSRGEPFRVQAEARVLGGSPARETGVALQATFNADANTRTLAITDALLRLEPTGAPALEATLPAAMLDLAASTLQAAQLGLSGTGVAAEASLNADWSRPQAAVANGRLALKQLDLPALLGALGSSLPPALNAEALGRITLVADYDYDPERLRLEQLAVTAGDFDASGRVQLGLGGKRRIDARLTSPELDIDYFLPPPEIPPGNAEEPPPDAGGPGALGALLAVDGAIEANVGRLKRGTLELGEVAARLALAPGNARLERLQATLYGGTLKASGALGARDGGARATVDAALAGVDLAQLLAVTADTRRVGGRVDGSLQLTANGTDTAALLDSLAGPVQLTIADPVIEDFSAEEAICKAAAAINRESLTASFEPVTRLQSMRTALDFRDGVGRFRELGLVLPNMRMDGDGSVDLPRRRLDVRLDVRVTNDLAERDPACRMSRRMLAIDWPLRCAGSFDEEPKKWCGIDKDGLAKIAGQLATDKVQDKLRDKLKDKLGGFLNRD